LGDVLEALKQAPWLVGTGLTYILATYRRVDRATVLKEVRRVMPEYEEEMLSMAAREWMAEGMAKGVAEGRAKALLVVLKERFGSVARETRNRVKAASAQEVDRWLKRALSATSVDRVFGPRH
jgi:phosphotransacetylase